MIGIKTMETMITKINSRNLTLFALTCVCFWVAFSRIHSFYVEHVPIGPEGACYNIKYPDFKEHYQIQIFRNDFESKSSMVMISLLNVPTERWSYVYTFSELRMLSPKRMECK